MTEFWPMEHEQNWCMGFLGSVLIDWNVDVMARAQAATVLYEEKGTC